MRWNPVAGAKRYTVKISSPTGVIWQTETSQSQIQYPGQPTLEPGVPYSLVVQSDDLTVSTSDTGLSTEFRLLRDAERKIIQSKIQNLPSSEVLAPAVALSLSDLYHSYTLPPAAESAYRLSETEAATYGLTAEGIEILTSLIKLGTSSPSVHRSLGNLYWHTGLVQLAIAQYNKAIELAKKPEELEDSAESQFRMGEIYAATADRLRAIESYERAKEEYALLADIEKVKFLERQIQSLKSDQKSKN
ncbi:MAG: tetratricopeptide repeat protein [Leptolyngbya sp. Prado105]|nr:tetratricopeptide repeat protein [Leptolyngbya sp. Prado105]